MFYRIKIWKWDESGRWNFIQFEKKIYIYKETVQKMR